MATASLHEPSTPKKKELFIMTHKRSLEERRYRLEKIAVVVAAVYAAITFCMWRAMQAATDQARQEFAQTERPWIGVAATEIVGPPTDSNLAATVDFENSGRSPASQLSLRAVSFAPVTSDNEHQVRKECAGQPSDAGGGALLLPGVHRQVMLNSMPLEPSTIEYIRQQLALRPKIKLDRRPEGVFLVGCIDYMWGNDCYRTRFCRQYTPTAQPKEPFGSFSDCNFSNDTIENPNCKQGS